MSSASATGTTVEATFGTVELKKAAAAYHGAKRMVDACASYDTIDDAIADLQDAWTILTDMVKNGSGYTPDRELGFGSDSAAVIGETIMGVRKTVGAVRKSFNTLGK